MVVGNGMAAMRTLEELMLRAPSRYEITVVGAEPYANYNRILLPSVLAGETTVAEITTHPPCWYEQHGIRVVSSDRVVEVDRRAKAVRSTGNLLIPYDKLLLATGSKPLVPPIAGLDLPGACTFRDISDVEWMIEAARPGGRAVVIVTHDSRVLHFADRIVRIEDGTIAAFNGVEMPPPGLLTQSKPQAAAGLV